MSRPDQERCRLCSKLDSATAKLKHGSDGTGCWDDQHCHNRRSYYRHRGVRNYNRKQRYHLQRDPRVNTPPSANPDLASPVVNIITIPAPAAPAPVLFWYRETKQSPLHAISAELWMGNDRVAKIEPVHCLGLTELQIKTLLLRILEGFSQHCGQKLERFRASVELHPLNCPVRPCPLYPDELS
jgi:hypothetical protein